MTQRKDAVGLLDVSLHSENGGDHVITESILRELRELGSSEWRHFSTHRHPPIQELPALKRARVLLAGGSNLIKSHMEKNRQWLVTPDLLWAMRGRVVLCGVGWWQYQEDPCAYSRLLLRQLLDPKALHSVRDSYTADKLSRLGYHVANTGCPTMWSLGERARVSSLSNVVVTSLTDYNRVPERDVRLLESLKSLYREVRFVGMAEEDMGYFASLGVPDIQALGWGLSAMNAALEAKVDYVGTRLHAGVRAMELGRTAVVLAIDNRAAEISRDTALPIVRPDDISPPSIRNRLNQALTIDLRIPEAEISRWRESFGSHVLRRTDAADWRGA